MSQRNTLLTALMGVHRRLSAIVLAIGLSGGAGVAAAAEWTVTIRAHSVEALTNTDAWGEQDMYWVVSMTPAVGVGDPAHCSTDDEVQDNRNRSSQTGRATIKVSGGPDTTVGIALQLFDQDSSHRNVFFFAGSFNPRRAQTTVWLLPV